MSDESLDDPVRETHGHFDGLLRLVSASALQITDRRAQQRLYGATLGRGTAGRAAEQRAHPAGSALVREDEAATVLAKATAAQPSPARVERSA